MIQRSYVHTEIRNKYRIRNKWKLEVNTKIINACRDEIIRNK